MSKPPKIDPQEQARILSEALPHMQRYDEEIVVVKYGGHAMGQEQMARDFARDIVLLEQTAINPVVVHGGGPQIEAMLKKLGIKSEFAAGLRITDEKTVEIVEMVLAGSINKQIVGYINRRAANNARTHRSTLSPHARSTARSPRSLRHTRARAPRVRRRRR